MDRHAAVAGTWYPGRADVLAREIDRYLALARPAAAVPADLVALLAPHAGLVYSGPVAAYGYASLEGRHFDLAVLVGPSHYVAFDGAAVWPSGAFETPLGPLQVDASTADALLRASPVVRVLPAAHDREHSLEMQLPFLQRLVPSLRIVPVLMGTQSPAEVDALALALGRALRGRDVLLVASSDLSHYQPAAVANRQDAVVVDALARYDDGALLDRLERHGNVACGGGPIVAVMRAARALGADRAVVLRYADSGDAGEHDKSHVVGYLSAALLAGTA